jgi:2-amino-4-hydroxy-6-hydroxymethyldihydropteridine diphosphokinase
MPLSTAARVYLGIGTNLGDRLQNLQYALAALPESVRVVKASRIYETAPWGYLDQPNFLNQVVEVETSLTPLDLLGALKRIEQHLGRQQTFRYGPRQIDIDILLYGRQVIEAPGLQIPHPRFHERAFVLVPLAELAPGLRHPVLRRTVSDLLQEVDASGVKVFEG